MICEECISDLEDKIVEFTRSEQQKGNHSKKKKENKTKNKESISREGPQEEKRERRGLKNVFQEIMTENFPNLKKETDIHVQEALRVPNKMNPN